MNNKLSKGISIIFFTNIINMAFSLIINFILPKYLSYETYAVIKTFQLYISYAGFFHLGYSDGMYLHYGGKELKYIDKYKLSLSLSTMRIFQFTIALIVVLFSLFVNNRLFVIFAFDILSYNLVGYFKNMFQAVGEFKYYSRITNIVTVLNFILNMIFAWMFKLDNPYIYIIGYTLVDSFAWLLLEVQICHLLNIKFNIFTFSLKEFLWNIKDGILLLFGNLTSILITSMDRWFTKIFLTSIDFAQYSFAVSVENFLNIAITPITITLYNYLCKKPDINEIYELKNKIILFATSLMAAYFPIKFILEIYLDKYIKSAIIIALLFASQMFYIVIKSIYVNLYKASMNQKKYLIEVIIIIIISFIFNSVLFLLYRIKESFALGTLFSAIVWYIICQIDFKRLRIRKKNKELIYQGIELVLFLTCAILFDSISGFICYTFITLILTLVLMKESFKNLIYFLARLIKNMSKKI